MQLKEIQAKIGAELGCSDWLLIDQSRVDRFAEVTQDHQYIHVDPRRAAATPFGGTIAHGLLTLSLLPCITEQVEMVTGASMVINYGFDRVRFITPVKVGSRVRGRVSLLSAEERSPGQLMLKVVVTVEIEGEKKPALVAEWLTLNLLK